MKQQDSRRRDEDHARQAYSSHLVALEQRVMFDAAAVATVADTIADHVAAEQAKVAVAEHGRPAHAAPDSGGASAEADRLRDSIFALGGDGEHPSGGIAAADAPGNSYIFIDTSVTNYQALADIWADRGTVVLIDSNRDGIDQMRLALAGQANIDSIHIVSHGQAAGFMLGTTWVDAATAQGGLRSSLEAIGTKLAPDGDILIYGCDIGADNGGRTFLDTLAAITSADIAASSDDTGAAASGGNWDLEARVGDVQTMALDGGDWNALLAQTVLNPTGGTLADGSDGIRIHVTTTGQFQVRYQNSLQFYNPTTTVEGSSLYNGMYMAVGNQVIGPDTGAEAMTNVAWSSLGQTLTGTGTNADPFVVTTRLYYNVATTGYQAATDYLATVSVSYVAGTRYFTNTVTITPPTTNAAAIKWYHAADTFLGGSDSGPAYALAPGIGSTSSTLDDISLIGTRRGFGTASEVFVGFAEVDGDRQFDRFYSGFWNDQTLYGSGTGDGTGIAGGGNITNTINTATIDNGLGVQFNLGAVNSATTFSYRLVFDGDTSVDLDANNSTALGNNFVTSYGVGSGQAVAVVDSDIAISNIVADIARATVTINNAQAGDVLSVLGTLPTGITASIVGNVVTLSGSASEASYQDALKQIRFNTTSTALINRGLTVAVYNEISSEAATANTTINMARPPVVDLNSGTVANQIVSNGAFSSGLSGWTTTGAGGTATAGGNMGFSWTTDNSAGTLRQAGITGWDVGSAPSGAAQLVFDLGWNNGTPDGPAASRLQVSVGGVVYAEITTGTTVTGANTATITYLNGASGSPANMAASAFNNWTRTPITINLPSTVAATGDLLFSYSSLGAGARDDLFIDNVSALTQVDATAGVNFATSYTENGPFVSIADTDNSVRDIDSANMVSATIVLTNAFGGDVLNINSLPAGISGSVDTSVPGRITVQLTGTASKDAYAAAIRAVTFGNSSDNPSTTSRTVQVTVNDGTVNSAVATTTITVIAVNDAPTNTLPAAAQSTPEDTPLVFSTANGNAIRVADPDNNVLTVTLWTENGILGLSTVAGLTFLDDTTDNSSTMRVSGTVAAINAALEGARFFPTEDNSGGGKLTIQTSDGALTDTDSITIDFTPVADAKNDSANTNLGTPVQIDVIANDPFSGKGFVSAIGAPANGTAVRNPDGTITYTPNGGFVGTDSFTYTAATVDPGFRYEYFAYNPPINAVDTFASNFPTGFPTMPAGSGWTPTISVLDAYELAIQNGDTDGSMAVRWSGQFLVLNGGTYTFNVQADNVGRLFIDGVEVQTNGYNTPGATVTVTLAAGVHNFELQWSDAGGNEKVGINYSGADTGGALTNVSSSWQWGTEVRYETATVNVVVTDQPPSVTVPGAQSTAEDAPLAVGGVSISDVDSPSVTATLTVTGGTASVSTGGGAAITGNGSTTISLTGSTAQVNAALAGLSFTGNADYNGPAQIAVTVNDGRTTNSDTIAITVTPVADITNDVVTTNEDAPISFNVLTGTNGATADNFESPGRTVTSITQPPAGQGSVSFAAGGLITYTPPANFNGTTSFTYTVTSGGVTETATVTVNVTAVNDVPVNTAPATATVAEDVLTPITGLSVTDIDGDTLTVTLTVLQGLLSPSVTAGTVTGSGTSTLTINGSAAQVNSVLASLRYRGNADYNGADTLTMTTSDGTASDSDTILITVTPVADITNDVVTTNEDAPISFNVLTGTNGATADNFESPGRAVTSVTQPPAGQGSVAFVAGGLITYTPTANYSGTTSFTYTVTSGGVTETATVTVHVIEQNDVPTTTGVPAQTSLDGQAIDLPLIMAFADIDGDTLTFSATGLPLGLSINPTTGVISGSIDNSASQTNGGVYTIAVTANDGRGGTVTANFTWTVTNPAPVAANDTAVTNEDTPVTIAVLANDADPDGDTLTIGAASAGHGTVTINANGTLTYTPASNYNGADTIIYTISDGEGGRSTATVTITVAAVNDAPTTIGLPGQHDADSDVITVPVASAFSDVDGDTLTFSAGGLPPGLSINPVTGVISGTLPPDASLTGPYSVTVTATDPSGQAASTTFVWMIQNVPPLADDDVAMTAEDTSVTVFVMANDVDPDGDAIRIVDASATHGTVTINGHNSLTFTPDADFHGVAEVTYRITDDEGGFSTATLTVTVTAVNDTPDSEPIPNAVNADSQTVSVEIGDFFSDRDGDTLSYAVSGLPTGLSIDPVTGVISGTFANNASQGGVGGVYSVTVTATDPGGLATSRSFSWTITNPAPTAVNDLVDTPEDTPITIDVLANDSDPDGDPLTIIAADATHGSVTINGDGTITFIPDADFEGIATVVYTISDGNGGQSTAAVRINVIGENDPPVAVNDNAATKEDVPVTIPVLTNDSDVDGDPLVVTSAVAANGTVVINANGTITYTPNANFNGTDTVTYVIEDGQGGTATATVTVTVAPVNDAPVALDDSAATDEDVPVTIAPLVNDSDVDGDPLTITSAGAANGSVVINGDGTITYTPNANFNGTDTISYTIIDGKGGIDTATVTVTVRAVNDAPTPVGSLPARTGVDNGSASVPTAAGFADVDDATLTYSTSGLPAGLTIDAATGVISGTINRSASQVGGGAYIVTVTATDAAGLSATQHFTWTITNPAPTATNDSATTPEDVPVTISVLANDSDPDGDPLTVTAANAAHGSVVINGNGTLTYTPNANFNGTDTIIYSISDGEGGTATATVMVTVSAVNDAPVTAGLAPRNALDSAVISGVSVAAGFSDVDGDVLTYTASGLPSGLTLNPATGAISGTIAADASTGGPNNDGLYQVTVTATDPSGALVSTSFVWTIGNPAPIATADTALTNEDVPVTIDVLANDSDPDGDPLTVTAAHAANGSVVINGDGTVTYTPNLNFNGTDTITYTISDGQGGSDTTTVTVTVAPVNDAPTANGTLPPRTHAEGVSISIATAGGFADVDNATLTYSASGMPAGLSIDTATGLITGAIDHLAAGPTGTLGYTVIITATDADGLSATQQFTWTVNNPAPTAIDDVASTNEDVAVIIPVLVNDSDPDGDTLTITGAIAGHGTVVINGDGTLTYTPNANFNGNDVVTYTISDGQGGTDTATITITVAAVNDAPVSAGLPPRTDSNSEIVSVPAGPAFSDIDGDTLIFTATGLPAGVVIDAATGAISGTIASNASTGGLGGNGIYQVTVTADDGNGGTISSTFTWTITNIPPVAADDSFTIAEDVAADLDVLANDIDPDGNPLPINPFTHISATHGTATANPDGTIHFVPDADFNGIATITYTIQDSDGDHSTATVTITVTPVNDAPEVPIPLSNRNSLDGMAIAPLPLGGLFTDRDGDTLSFSATGLPGGLAIDPATGTVTGTIDADASVVSGGVYTVQITADDGHGGTVTTYFTWSIGNPAPVAADDSAMTAEDTSVAIDVLTNDSDPDGDALVVLNASATNGQIVIGAGGVLTYTPNTNFNGTDTITYTISDGQGGTDTATVTVTVTPVNDAPVANGTLPARTAVDGASVSVPVASAFTDVDNATLGYSASGLPVGLSIDPATGVISGTIGSAASQIGGGVYSVTITATDAEGASAVQVFTWTIANPAPVAVNDSATTSEDAPVTVAVLANDSDPDGDTLSVVAANASNGTVVINADGTITYTPNANFNGTDTISYTISDGQGGTATATVTVTVASINDVPVAVNDSATTNEDAPVTIPVLANDSDVDGDPLTVTSSSAGNGTVTINPDGTISYTPNANFNGSDTISYTISDGNGGTATATVTVTVNPVNDAPVAVNDSVTTNEDVPVTIPVLANDSDVDGDPLTVTGASAGNGTVTINPDGTITYTPNANFNGSDTISYTISDGNGGTATATVTVTVAPVNDAPVAVNDSATTNEDVPVTIPVLANDSDVDGDPLTVTGATAGNGTVSINPDGTITYTPNSDFNGTDTVSYTISDGKGGTSTATVTVTVNPVNDAPVAVNDNAITDEGSPVTIPVLANDSDVDGDPLTVTNASAGNGTVTINPDGTITYTPNAHFNGTDTISYTISDGNGGTDTATVTVTVGAINDAPVAVNDDTTTNEDVPVTIPVLANDSDVDGDPLIVTSATAGNGTVTINPDGTITYTPNANFNGSDTITYTVSDGKGGTSTATATVTVTPVNDAPIAVNDNATTNEDTPVTIPVLANDGDVDGDPLTVTGASAPHGTVAINPDGTITYTPNPDFNGTDTISYTISDGKGGTSTATVSVTVSPVNDAPAIVDDVAKTPRDEPVTIPVLVNDSDVDGDPLTVTGATADSGTVVVNPDGTITYTPQLGFVGTATITYTVSDGKGGTTTGTATITVTEGPASPDIETLLEIGRVGVPDSAWTPPSLRPVDRGFIIAPPVILNTVNRIASLGGTLDLADADGIILTSVNRIAPLHGTGTFDAKGHPILDEVERIAQRNTLQAGGGGLFEQRPGRFDLDLFAGSSLNAVANDNGLMFETVLRGSAIYLEIRDTDGTGPDQVERFELLGADGTPPSWIQFDARGLAIIDPPAGSDLIPLTIRAIRADGSVTDTRVVIRAASGQVEIGEQTDHAGGRMTLNQATTQAAGRAATEVARLMRAFGT
jgi:CshA-type fibril repeat protein